MFSALENVLVVMEVGGKAEINLRSVTYGRSVATQKTGGQHRNRSQGPTPPGRRNHEQFNKYLDRELILCISDQTHVRKVQGVNN